MTFCGFFEFLWVSVGFGEVLWVSISLCGFLLVSVGFQIICVSKCCLNGFAQYVQFLLLFTYFISWVRTCRLGHVGP